GLVSKEPDPEEMTKLLGRRGGPPLDAFEHIVHHGGKEARIEIHEKTKGEQTPDWLLTMSTSRVTAEKSDNDGKPMKGPKIRLGTQIRRPSVKSQGQQHLPSMPNRPVSHPEQEIFVNDDNQQAFSKSPATPEPFSSNLVDLETVREHEALE